MVGPRYCIRQSHSSYLLWLARPGYNVLQSQVPSTWHLHYMASQDGPSQQPAAAPEITDSGDRSKVVDDVHVMNVPLTETNDDQQIRDDLFDNVMDGDWDAVVEIYIKHKIISQTAKITKSKETALHIAIMDNKTEAAKELLELVDAKRIKDMKNERENNPLHLAAARGQVDICKRMIEKDEELIWARNKDGETPLFLAALHGKRGAFYAMHPICPRSNLHLVHDITHCRRNLDGNSILHVAILGEYFGSTVDHLIRELPSDFKEQSPGRTFPIPENYRACFDLFEIAQKAPKIFFSSPNQLEAQREKGDKDVENQSSPVKSKCSPERSKDKEKHAEEVEIPPDTILQEKQCKHKHLKVGENTNKGDSKKRGRARKVLPDSTAACPPNYSTFFALLEFMMELFLFVFGLGFFKVHKIKEMKRKHTWTVQVMQELVSQADEWEYEETGSQPPDLEEFRAKGISPEEFSVPPMEDKHKPEVNMTDRGQTIGAGATPKQAENAKEMGAVPMELRVENVTSNPLNPVLPGQDNQNEKVADVKGMRSNGDKVLEATQEKSPILVAAKMGVTEMVKDILLRFPVAIEDMNQDKKNVVLLAVENRQPRVYTFLQNKYATNESIFQKLDKEGNSALHLAATLGNYRPWMIPGAALQMQWELKWYEFINVSMPHHFFARLNDSGRTAKEVFTETHRELVKDGGTWLTNTSQSCSVVAALIATVAFASATTVPGGVKQDRGTPTLEGKPAFDLFAISSLVALCFSVTSLTMFLSILTSRYQVKDFHYSLPTKLILGLSSLFVSIAAMLVSFCAGHFFVLADRLKLAAFPVYAITCLPVTLFAVAQFPLYIDLLKSSMAPVPKRSYEEISL